MFNQEENKFQTIAQLVKELVSLHITNFKYNVAEKLSIILSTAAVIGVAVLILISAMIFFGIFLANLLSTMMANYWAFLIVVGIYLLILVAIVLLRDVLIVNPVARFISKLIVDAPQTEATTDNN